MFSLAHSLRHHSLEFIANRLHLWLTWPQPNGKSTRQVAPRCIPLPLFSFADSHSAQAQETLIPHGASWRWRRGTNEVSNPTTAWRQPGFNDSAWLTAAMPFYYGPGGTTGGTVLSDMRYNYTTVYLRRTFMVEDPDALASLTLREVIDDGFIVWINGVEVQRYNVDDSEQPYNAGTPVAIGSSPVEASANLGNPAGLLVPGSNTIAVHLFNRNLTSSDIHLNLELQATLLNTNPPAITSVSPPNGATVTALSQVEVIFNRPVSGVDAQDLEINGQPATDVTGAESGPYVFLFPQPTPGTVNFSWVAGHGIADLVSNAFSGGGWSVTLNPAHAPGDVIINEFVAGNLSGLMDEDGERPDWIELHNRGASAVNLLGWSLTDAPDVPGQWTFPSLPG